MFYWMLFITVIIILILMLAGFCSLSSFSPKYLSLENSHVLITGASSGIGFEMAKICASQGAKVTMVARNKDRLEKARKSILLTNNNQKIICIPCDVSDCYESINKMINQAVDSNGLLDFLICNAGVCYPGVCKSMAPESFTQSININLTGPCLLCTSALSKMSSSARIVFVSSQAGQIGIYGYSSYSPAKFGLLGFAQALQMETLNRNIYVTIAYPPDTNTPGHQEEVHSRLEETKILSETSDLLEASVVAKQIIKCSQAGNFTCSFGIIGKLLSITSSGASPVYNPIYAIMQACFASPAQLLQLIMMRRFYSLIRTMTNENKKTE